MKQIKECICTALQKCGYKDSIEDLMLFADFRSTTGNRLAFGSTAPYNQVDEEEFMELLEQFCKENCAYGKIWLTDESFFIFREDEGDWQHIDCHVPEDLDPEGVFLS